MIYHEIRHKAIPSLSFMKDTDYILYVGPELTPLEQSKLHSKDIDVPVIYLPEVLQGISKEMFEYNFPGVAWPGEISAELIYSQIRSELGKHLTTPESRILLKFDGAVLVIFDAKDSFSLAISYLINKCQRKPRFCAEDISRRISFEELFEARSADLIIDTLSDDCLDHIRPLCEIECSEDCCWALETADDSFDEFMDSAAEEVREAIKRLLLKGFSASVIRSWLDEDIKLSRLRITRQYNILLVDYDKEVKMGPLPKTIFLFFLRHPEGVMFSHLMDHREELLNIYSHVCKNDNPEKMHDSIDRLVNPFDNSINEKCAAVKKAFMLLIADDLAANYYISGAQGEKKGIPLDRRLVEWECEL